MCCSILELLFTLTCDRAACEFALTLLFNFGNFLHNISLILCDNFWRTLCSCCYSLCIDVALTFNKLNLLMFPYIVGLWTVLCKILFESI